MQPVENDLIAALKRRGAAGIVHTHDDAAATLNLSDRALDYARQIILAQESDVPIGSDAVARALGDFQIAAAAFTSKLAASEGLDSKIPRWVEENLVAMFTQEQGAS